jgi:hypothetical protein
MVIVDSTVWIDYLATRTNAQTLWLKRQSGHSVGLIDLILCEVLQGVRTPREFRRVQQDLETLPILNTGGAALAIASARNYCFLRSKGLTVRKTIDCMIATLCTEQGHVLLHNDRDFDPFEQHLGLRVVHP